MWRTQCLVRCLTQHCLSPHLLFKNTEIEVYITIILSVFYVEGWGKLHGVRVSLFILLAKHYHGDQIKKWQMGCVHNMHVRSSHTNKALFINLVKSFKFTLKYTIILLLHVSVFNDHHQGALSVPNWNYVYVKTLS